VPWYDRADPAVSGHTRDTGIMLSQSKLYYNFLIKTYHVWSKVMFVFSSLEVRSNYTSRSAKALKAIGAQRDWSSTGLTSVKENADKMTILSRLSETLIHLCSVATWEWQKTKMAELLLALLLPYIITRVVSNQRSNAHCHWLWSLEHLGPKGIQLTFCHVRIAPGSK
jgi:hypothetical protein